MKLRRLVVRGGVLLLVGAALNVLVAWVCAMWAPLAHASAVADSAVPTRLAADLPAWWSSPHEQDGFVDLDFDRRRGWGVEMHGSRRRESGMAYRRVSESVVVLEAGWPLPVVRTHAVFTAEALTKWSFGEQAPWKHGVEAPPVLRPRSDVDPFVAWFRLTQSPRPLPYQPIWWNTLASAALYASVLGTIVVVVRATRRSWRRGRGLCPRCSYPIGSTPLCSECGETVR